MKKPSLDTVYKVLSKLLQTNAYILVSSIEAVDLIDDDKVLPTLGITKDRRLIINTNFWEKHLQDSDDNLMTVLYHELLHVIFGDIYSLGSIDPKDPERELKQMAQNVAMDSRINSFISRTAVHDTSFFIKFYKDLAKDNPLHNLLFPGNLNAVHKVLGKQMGDQYDLFYNGEEVNSYVPLYYLVLDYLRKNAQYIDVVLVGDHLEDGQGNKLPEEVKSAVLDAIKEMGKQAGKGDQLIKTVVKDHAAAGRIDLNLLKRYRIQGAFKNVKLGAVRKVGKYTTSPIIPSNLARFDMVRAALDIPVTLWKAFKYKEVYDRELLPIYLDVSGSMDRYIPNILDVICNIDDKLDYMWLFSTKIVKHTMEQLKRREIETTGGTDFDIVIEHAVENNFSNIIVITDGCCGVSVVKGNEKHPKIKDVVTVLIDDGTEQNWFSQAYNNTHKLQDLVAQ